MKKTSVTSPINLILGEFNFWIEACKIEIICAIVSHVEPKLSTQMNHRKRMLMFNSGLAIRYPQTIRN